MSDWSKPTLTSQYANFLTEVSGRLDDSARQNRSDTVTLTFPPVGLIRWNAASSRWETNTGTTSVPVWTALAATYAINAATAAQWATTRTLAATGDVTSAATNIDGSSNVSLATTLATVNSNVGSFGSGVSIPTITVNAKGLVTAVTTNALGGMAGQAASAVAITGGSISGTNLTLVQSTTAAPTAEGRMEWDTDNDLLVVGTSAASKLFAPLDPTTAVTETNRTMSTNCNWTGNDVAPAHGGTGVSTLSGLAFGNGTSAFTAATAAQVVAAIGATAVANATTLAAGTDRTKLDGIAAGANAYSHPANHPASIITQDASNRFVTDAEKTAWNAKQPAGTYATGGGTATGTNTGDQTSVSGNAGTATHLLNGRDAWFSGGNLADVAGQLGWKNFGNSHTIFDASAGTAPNGAVVSNTNPGVAWTATYPTLMGWNGSSTYGVRVDSARVADTVTTAPAPTTAGVAAAYAGVVSGQVGSTALMLLDGVEGQSGIVAADTILSGGSLRYAMLSHYAGTDSVISTFNATAAPGTWRSLHPCYRSIGMETILRALVLCVRVS